MNKLSSIHKSLRIAVWDTNGGRGLRYMKCYTGCGSTIALESFECGHNIAKSRGGKAVLSNLKPICGICNRSMGVMTFSEFMKESGYQLRPSTSNDKIARLIALLLEKM